MEVEPRRFNVLAWWGDRPAVTLSTHIDTVPPFFPSREDDEHICGRGACDTKGIIASMIKAAGSAARSGARATSACCSWWARSATAPARTTPRRTPRGSRFLINGEPTENQLALGSKGALRYEIDGHGPHGALGLPGAGRIGDSTSCSTRWRPSGASRCRWTRCSGASTLNIGTIAGGRAPNVIPDEAQRRDHDPAGGRFRRHQGGRRSAPPRAARRRARCSRSRRCGWARSPAFDTTVVAYTTDIPAFGGAWGEPFLIGPGSIHVAHTLDERVPKAQLLEAVEIYQRMVRELLTR